MALSQPRNIYSVHSVSPYSRSTGEFYGELRVLESSQVSLSAESIGLRGGSNRFEWSSEIGDMTAECQLAFSEYPDFVFTLFAGNAPTAISAETGGSITTLTNKYGTSVKSATTGITSATITTAADAKFGKYVVKCTAAAVVDVYFSSDLDLSRGTDVSFSTDTLKAVASLTISTGAPTVVTGHGVSLTGGSGTIGMTTGDTATFEVRPISQSGMSVTIGQQADQSFPEFGMIIMSSKYSTGAGYTSMFEIDALKCKGAGLPIGFNRNAHSKAEVKISMLYDSVADGVYKVRYIQV